MSEIVNIPDEIFRNCILKILNKPNDYTLTKYDCESVTMINCSYYKIKSLEGIEYFTNLNVLYCNNTKITDLDVSKNIYLNELYCDSNDLISLDLSKNTRLFVISCACNELTILNLGKNTNLNVLYCGGNKITSLDLSNITNLIQLCCGSNKLTSLDISKNKKLFKLINFRNKIKILKLNNLIDDNITEYKAIITNFNKITIQI